MPICKKELAKANMYFKERDFEKALPIYKDILLVLDEEQTFASQEFIDIFKRYVQCFRVQHYANDLKFEHNVAHFKSLDNLFWKEFLPFWFSLDDSFKNYIFTGYYNDIKESWLYGATKLKWQNQEYIGRKFISKMLAVIAASLLSDSFDRKKTLEVFGSLNIDWIELNYDLTSLDKITVGYGWGMLRTNYQELDYVAKHFENKDMNTFDMELLMRYICSSLSLNKDEKMRVFKEIPSLNKFQIDALFETFAEEQMRWLNMNLELQIDDIRRLYQKSKKEWNLLIEELDIQIPTHLLEKEHPEESKEEDEVRVAEGVASLAAIQNLVKTSLKTPSAMKACLDEYVKGQENAKIELSTALYYQALRKIHKQFDSPIQLKPSLPIVLVGPTGNGKTFVVEKACQIINLPFVHINTSEMVGEGIAGYSLSDIGRNILEKVDNSLVDAEFAIVFLDEFDKLLAGGYYGEDVLHQLLRVLEGGDLVITSKRGDDLKILKTTNFLFIMAGAFQVQFDKKEKSVGFSNSSDNTPLKLTYDNLHKQGFPKEILGRLGSIITLEKLDEEDMYSILTQSKGSPLEEFIHRIEIHGDSVQVEDEALRAIAKMAANSSFGVRAIRQILTNVFAKPIFEAPNLDIQTFVISEEYVKKYLDIMR